MSKVIRKSYASKLTREDLIARGVTYVDLETLTVYGKDKVYTPYKNQQGYLMISLCDIDENGNRIKVYSKHNPTNYSYRTFTISLSRLLWIWAYGFVEEGHVIDHKDNHHFELNDYRLDNLQSITPAANIVKERDVNKKQMRGPKSLEVYNKKLEKYLALYEEAKANGDAVAAHRLRSNIANNRAKIRYKLNEEGKDGKHDLQESKLH